MKMPDKAGNLCGLEPQLIKLEFIIYLPKLKVSRALWPFYSKKCMNLGAILVISTHFYLLWRVFSCLPATASCSFSSFIFG